VNKKTNKKEKDNKKSKNKNLASTKNLYKTSTNKKRKNINKLKVIPVVIIALIILGYAGYTVINLLSNPSSTFIVTKGELSQEESVTGYIIRSEVVIKGENYKNGMIKIKDEGSRVAKDDAIFRYYSSGEEKIKEKIASLNTQIQEIMSNEQTVFTSDIKLLEEQIEKEIASIDNENSLQKIQEYKKNIDNYINKKAIIAGEYSPAGSTLKQLIEERKQYENQLEETAEYITATESGVVSYRVDGLEEILQPDNFGTYNKEFLENLNLKAGQIVASSEEMGKIVNNYECYIILNSNSEQVKEVNVGDKIQIRLQDASITKAEVVNIITEDDESKTITLKLEKSVESLIDYRKISLDIIWWSAEGYRVANDTLIEQDGLYYVVRNRNGYYNKMLVKILKQNDEFCIVKSYDTDELKELGFTSSEIYNMKSIALYDEILLNPTEEQLLQ
jgi:hypothetical protein